MTADRIRAARAKVAEEHGPWTAHDIALGHGVSTMDRGLHQQWRVDWFASLIKRYAIDLSATDRFLHALRLSRHDESHALKTKRILDLACLEGLFAIEFARMGASTVGLEIRETHLAKARFALETTGVTGCRFVQGDVRSIPDELGRFDIIICAGILYHLDFPDCVTFIRDVARRSDDLVIVDSHFAYDDITASVLPLTEMRSYEFGDGVYRGRAIVEHADHVTEKEKASDHVWASIDNNISVWLDERDVVKLMNEEGFDLVCRAYPNKSYEASHPDRPTLAFKRR